MKEIKIKIFVFKIVIRAPRFKGYTSVTLYT